ncbi:DUF3035 domain-containing protein [Falsiroseomonas selenitidurans]|uniref:DUF3035 domain-containing protein n=1 Tax=Falsiroseomonas selenitidurans TaxID=2716335 RepID=A0ABX1E9L1_9PROT|nr:DUF3035 domain-containing protein [Falsiroseomonas selenitidurans]NKC33716.1 DUF3035 domain-containing protein [Falsiroseomonas selenitidurans]
MTQLRTLLLGLPLLAALAGCGGDTARSLGFTRDPPDEFQVTTRAPLSVPPRLTELPPPTPGAPRPQDQRPPASAILGVSPSAGPAAPSGAERALLAQAGRPVDDSIRAQVDAESLRLDRPSRSLVDRLMFWRATPPPGTAVDAQREAQRLRENAALGRETTDGTTPVAQPPRRGLLD